MAAPPFDPSVIRDRLLVEGVIVDGPRTPTRNWSRPARRTGRNYLHPEDVYAALLTAGVVDAPTPSEVSALRAHPADLVEWAIVNWWPGYVARFAVETDDVTDLEASVAVLARHLSLRTPETTPKAAADNVRTYVYEAAFALLEGRPLPDPAAEPENRLQILRGITNMAASAAYGALVGAPWRVNGRNDA